MFNIRGMDPSATSSLRWKLPYLDNLVHQSTKSYSFISITETWLKPFITDAQMEIDGYTIYRSDRFNKERGGCCLYIQDSYSVSDHFKYDDDFCEIIVCSVVNVKTLLFCVYRTGETPHESFYDALRFMQSCVETKDDSWSIIITGDFNFPNIDWNTLKASSDGGCRQCADALLKFMESNLLCQIVNKPTRRDPISGTENILDLVITNNGDLFRDVDVLPTSMSDHDSVSIILSQHFNYASVKGQEILQKDTPVGFNSLNFHKADYNEINADLCKINWDSLKAESSYEDFPITFYQALLSICEKHTPRKIFSNKHKKSSKTVLCHQ